MKRSLRLKRHLFLFCFKHIGSLLCKLWTAKMAFLFEFICGVSAGFRLVSVGLW